jgi:hypothetical protein
MGRHVKAEENNPEIQRRSESLLVLLETPVLTFECSSTISTCYSAMPLCLGIPKCLGACCLPSDVLASQPFAAAFYITPEE